MKDLTREIRAYALKNALEFGKADAGRILPKLFQHGLQKEDIKKVMPLIQKAVKEVNALSHEERCAQFEKLKSLVKEREEKEKTLPELSNVEKGVVTRLPPEPSKYLHLGHALSFLINAEYAKKYGGKCLLRFEDANPEKVSQEYVDAILEDIRDYLQIELAGTRYVSDDMPHFYEAAEKLITQGAAFMCFCTREQMQTLRHEGKECACRKQSIVENERFWKEFLAEKYAEGKAVLRFKGDMQSANQVMRDPALFRIVKAKHFRQRVKYKVWPLYDLYNPIEDALMGVTHVLRTAEFDARVELHERLRELLQLPKLAIVQYGRFTVIGAETKGREIRERIAAGEYSGWDDPRLVTLRALKRRGIEREVLLELIQHLGLAKKQVTIDFAMIAALSRKLLDIRVNRYYFVPNPAAIEIDGVPQLKEVKIKMHPAREETRTVKVGKDIAIPYVDVQQFQGKEIRLMNLCNVQLNKQGTTSRCAGTENKHIPKVQWVSVKHALQVKVRMDTGEWREGLGEAALKKLNIGDMVQFERFGFVRLDKKPKKGALEFWFAHA